MNDDRPQPLATLARDAMFVALAAVATVQSLRMFVGDRYLVPTGSMEPVLHGHADDGDVVFVDKLADGATMRRHDLAVVAHPSDPGQLLVKRIAARGDDADACWIDLRQGDVWLGPDAQRLQREQKDPIAARGMRATWAASPGSPAARDGLDLRAADADLTLASLGSLTTAQAQLRREARAARRQRDGAPLPDGCIGTARPVDAGCVMVDGARSRVGGDVPVADAGMAVAFAALQGDLLLTIETRHEALTWRVQPAANKASLWRDGEPLREFDLPAPRGLVEFGLLDDRVFLVADGRRDAMLVVPRESAWNPEPGQPSPGPRAMAWFGVAGDGARVQATYVEAFRDVHYWREPILGMPGQAGGWPRHVPAGEWFLLGDSAFDSHDSRHFGPVAEAAFAGVPRAALGPWPRARWVAP